MDLKANRATANDEVRSNRPGMGAPSIASKILVILLIVISVLLIGLIASKLFFSKESASAIKSDSYQALFLTNGQVYFGKLSRIESNYVKLTDIYYLQVQQQVQPKDAKTQTADQPQVSLAKLGSELHGPEDTMYVAKAQVLFWENIKSDGKVVQAIKQYQSGGSTPK